MRVQRVDQLLDGFAVGDAISREARCLRQVLRDLGFPSDIFAPAAHIEPAVSDDCLSLQRYVCGPRDTVVFHCSIESTASPVFAGTAARKVLRYHNITPGEFFDGYDDALAARLRRGREALGRLAACADAVWAVSEFNASEIRELGIGGVRVVPLLFTPAMAQVEADVAQLAKVGGNMRNILFVGRMVPNKCVEDLILAFAWYHRCIERRSRLVLVGSERSCPRYYAMLHLLAGRLELPNVCFEGFLTDAQLAACYASADVFVSASRHEGYCLPLVEAMCHDVPVIARATGGTPEAMSQAGVLYDEMRPRVLAELVHRVLHDRALRKDVTDSQARRVSELRERDLHAECRALVAEVAASL